MCSLAEETAKHLVCDCETLKTVRMKISGITNYDNLGETILKHTESVLKILRTVQELKAAEKDKKGKEDSSPVGRTRDRLRRRKNTN